MSQYYYQQQRKEDIASLQSMFGPPWTFDLLGGVLDYYHGNVDEAISRLLILNEHHHGNPKPLVERLLLSGNQSMPMPMHRPMPMPTKKAASKRMGGASTADIPKSMLKKAPPPRRTQVAVTMADTFEPAVITIDKQTRRRVGIPMKLPEDFLRIPKTPLFAPNHLDHLIDMPPPEPLHNSHSQSPDSQSAIKGTTTTQQQGIPSKLQALRASMNFPTFPQKNHDNTQNVRNRQNTQSKNNGNPPPAASATPTSMLSKFSVPKITAPALNLPKLTTKRNESEATHTNNTNSTPESTAGKNKWSLTSMGASSSLMIKKSSPQQYADSTPAAAANTSDKAGNTTSAKAGWSLATMSSSLKTPPSLARLRAANATDHTRAQPAQEQAVPREKTGANRWSLPAIGSSMMIPTKQHQQQQSTTPDSPPLAMSGGLDGLPVKVTYGAIPKLEHRGITVRQLKNIIQDVQHRCASEQWKSTETGYGLQPHQVTMYDLVKHYVLPRTQANACSFVEAAFGEHHNEYEHQSVQRPPQWFVSHTWSDSIFHVANCIEQHASDRGLDANTVTYWICALAMNQHSNEASIAIETIDESSLKNPLMTLDVMNATEGILSVVDIQNVYFKRIWCLWELFLALERSRASCFGDEGHYLIDIYTTTDDDKAVGLTDGSVKADMYRPSRHETKMTESSPPHENKESLLFHKQPCNKLEWSELRTLRQAQFRFQACFEALNVHLESSHACMEEDTRRIMNCIVQYNTNGNNIHNARAYEAEALTAHPGYARVNALIQGAFAALAYRRVLEDAVSDKAGDQDQERLRNVQTALSTSPIENLEVSFAGCAAFQIRDALKFAESLPASLRRLDLDYSFLEFQVAEEFAIGFGRLHENLQVFKLNLAFCSLGNLDRLWEELGKLVNLRHLVLVIHPNKNLTSVDGLTAALNNMSKLECLELEFDCYGEYSKLVAVAKGGAQLNNISSTYRNMMGKTTDSSRRTKELHQQFDRVSKLANLDIGGAYISDSSIQKLCRTLTSRIHDTKLASLKLRFLGSLGKKLRSVETIDDLQQTLQRIRNGLKFFE